MQACTLLGWGQSLVHWGFSSRYQNNVRVLLANSNQ
jgi:hypothetical protein